MLQCRVKFPPKSALTFLSPIVQQYTSFTLPEESELPAFKGTREARSVLLNKIYGKFQKYPTGSPERLALAKTGSVWREYFNPFDLLLYKKWESENKQTLNYIDQMSKKHFSDDIAKHRKVLLSHQSVTIEGYKLKEDDSNEIYDFILQQSDYFDRNVDLEVLVNDYVIKYPTKSKDVEDIRMFCSNSIAQESVLNMLHNHYLSEDDIMRLHKLILPHDMKLPYRITDIYGRSLASVPGAYRRNSAMAEGVYTTVYPYPDEVPANMTILLEQANSELQNQTIHPVLYALKFYSTFLFIHPFHDGNGRLGRILLLFFLKKYNYLPPIFQEFFKKNYLNALYLNQNGQPKEYLDMMVNQMAENLNQLEKRDKI